MKRTGDFSARHHTAFSLLEILVALGLFAIIISGLMALFPVALHTDKESEEETRALFIASGVMEALNSGTGKGPLRLAMGMTNSLPQWTHIEILPSSTNTDSFVAYNASCEPLRSLSEKEAKQPQGDPAAASIVTVSLSSKPALPGLITIEVSVASPAAAPATGRSIKRFTRLIATPAP